MKVVLDACVLYPTVMREMVLGVAARGLFAPLWSPRLLAEWHHTAARHGAEGRAQAEALAARMAARWPRGCITCPPEAEARLWLPDPGDRHVLAAAIAGHADGILTLNARDFPRHILAEEGLWRADPDGFLHGIWQAQPGLVAEVAAEVLATARRLSARDWQMRPLLKKARLPRLGRALDQPAAPGAS
ncbi:MAG: PIN domain-containing protein [Roseovarius sp.]|nr:PIN domain-containing protein [Roseovarius sp.]